jgi:hypothetical protein
MTLRMYLIFMSLSSFLSIGSWVYVLFSFSPEDSGFIGFLLFYVTLLMSMVGVLTILGLLLRMYGLKEQGVVSREVKISFRHAVLLSILATSSLIFSSQGVFHWWVLIVLILITAVIEYVFLTLQESRRS